MDDALAGLRFDVACPQCGAVLVPPHDVDTFTCASCGATLRPDDGVRMYRLTQRPQIGPDEAAQSVRGWLSGRAFPRDLAQSARVEIGSLSSFSFLRARSPGSDRVVPLADLPSAEVAGLGRMPAQLVAAESGGHPPGGSDVAVSPEALRMEVQVALSDPRVDELAVEERLYYPVRYQYHGERFAAVVEVGAGRVLATRRPARRRVAGEWAVSAGAAVLLLGEAVVLPGLPAKLIAIGLTALCLYPLTRWLVDTRG